LISSFCLIFQQKWAVVGWLTYQQLNPVGITLNPVPVEQILMLKAKKNLSHFTSFSKKYGISLNHVSVMLPAKPG